MTGTCTSASRTVSDDPYDLARFFEAQRSVMDDVLTELRQGEKITHWMWFIFPQVAGLGQSPMSRKYGIASLAEARAYLAHPVLGPRLTECTQLALRHTGRTALEIFGPDEEKFHSSMTLFRLAAPGPGLFSAALDAFFEGHPDRATLNRVT